MDRINTTQVTDPTSQQPWTVKSLDFLQNSIQDTLAVLAKGIIGADYDPTKVYVLNRCEKVGNVIDNGYVFYNEEVFIMAGADTSAYVNVPVIISAGTIIDPAYDPVTFSDGVNKYVHDIRRVKIADQVSGTGYADYSNVIFVNRKKETVSQPANFNFFGSSTSTGVTWTGPTHTYNVEIYVEMDVSVSYITDGRLGAQLKVKNLTTLGYYPAFCAVLDNTNTSPGKTRTQRLVATWRKTGIAGGTNLELFIDNTQADQHSAGNIYVRIKEF